MSITLWCFSGEDSSLFEITPSLTTHIMELKGMIKPRLSDALQGVSEVDLILWSPNTVISVEPYNDFAKRIGDWPTQQNFQPYARRLSEGYTVAKCFPNRSQSRAQPSTTSPKLDIIVQIVASALADLARSGPHVPTITGFTLILQNPAAWDSLGVDTLINSSVTRAELPLQHFEELRGRLIRKRYFSRAKEDLYMALSSTSDLIPWDQYFEPVNPAVNDLDFITETEILHYHILVRGLALRRKANYDEKKEWQVHNLLLGFLEAVRLVEDSSWGFGTSLPFHLVVEIPDGRRMYTPRSDFHIKIKDFPHLVLEVNSQTNESDRFRMLMQAACISRMGNSLRARPPTNKPIVIMAIYIDKDFRAHRYLLCQPDVGSTMVKYVSDIYDLTAPETAFSFIFQLYNFLSGAKDDNDNLLDPEGQLREAKNSVARQRYPSLPSKRKREETDDHSRDGREGAPYTSGGQLVLSELSRAGYTPTPTLPKELALITPLKPTMCQATSQSGVLVVLKTIVDSNERQLLQYLSGVKSRSNRTIPLLDVIDLSTGETIIVLPWKSPLDEVLRFGDRPVDVVSLCFQFVEGVDFLHKHKVAHCDLKPGNIVVDTKFEAETSPRLYIIDFDLAQFVESEETTTEGWCGTRPWVAPELGSTDGPTQRYSPILADRWACGQVIEHFAKYFPTYEGERKTVLRAFAQRLLDVNPRARPELSQLQAIHGSTKR